MRPRLPRPRGVTGITVAQGAALALPLIFVIGVQSGRYAILFLVALIAALFWEGIFAALRKRGFSAHGVTTAAVVVILSPFDLALWQMGLTISLGVVLGELVFGGRGFGFLNPAVVALALLVISFPEVRLALPARELALATLPGGMVLLAFGLISGRVMLGAVLAVVAGLLVRGQGVDSAAVATGLAFGLVFLISDPTSAASTNAGRWIYGGLAGGLVVLFSPEVGLSSEAVVFAALMASIFAPLIDHLVVLAHARRRRRRIDA